MPKTIGYLGNCGHWLQIDISEETCIPFDVFHGKRVPEKNPNATIIGVASKCPECFPDTDENEKFVYYRRDNVTSIRILENGGGNKCQK